MLSNFQSYRDFHADLYPETAGPVSTFFASQWMAGENRPVAKISLDPAKKQVNLMQVIARIVFRMIKKLQLLYSGYGFCFNFLTLFKMYLVCIISLCVTCRVVDHVAMLAFYFTMNLAYQISAP